jgi:hypothetical protein
MSLIRFIEVKILLISSFNSDMVFEGTKRMSFLSESNFIGYVFNKY